MKKKIFLTIVISFVVFLGVNKTNAMKIVPYLNSNYIMAVSDNQGTDRISSISIDENNIINSVEVFNDKTSEYEAILTPKGDSYVYPDQSIILSGDYLALEENIKDGEGRVDQFVDVFKLKDKEGESFRVKLPSMTLGHFSLYNNSLVTTEFVQGKRKIALFDVESSDKKTLFKDDNNDYLSPYLFKQEIIANVGNEMFLINKNSEEKESLGEFLGNQSEFLVMNDDYIAYQSFMDGKKIVVLYNRKNKERKVIKSFDEKNNLVNLELKNNYLTFSYREISDKNFLYLYNIENNFLQELETSNYFDKSIFASPTVTGSRFFWISNSDTENGVLHYADLDNLYNSDDYLELTKKFILREDVPERLRGQILLEVENKGQAWYVDPKENYIYFMGRPADALDIMREVGLGISNDDINKIPVSMAVVKNINDPDPARRDRCFISPSLDPDGDCLSTFFENLFGSDNQKFDTDGDGFNDYDEISNQYNPNGEGRLFFEVNNRLKGYVVLQVEENGEAWYIDKIKGERYFLGRPRNAFNTLRAVGLGISNNDFNSIIK